MGYNSADTIIHYIHSNIFISNVNYRIYSISTKTSVNNYSFNNIHVLVC